MNAGVWAVVSGLGLLVLVAGYVEVYDRAHSRGWTAGYLAGQRAERRTVSRWLSQMRQQASTAERTIDYLYERAWVQLQHLDPPSAPPDGGGES